MRAETDKVNHKRLLLLTAFALGVSGAGFAAFSLYSAWKSQEIAAACDALAASPFDSTKPPNVDGVAYHVLAFERAIPACEKAVSDQPNNARLKFQYGRALDAGKQGHRAVEAYKQAYDLRFSLAAMSLGGIHQEGRSGVLINAVVALKWFETAAEKGISFGKEAAANMLERGEGVPTPNIAGAAKYRRSLADEGNAEASEKLGLAIIANSVVGNSPDEAIQRLLMAADKGRFSASAEYAKHLYSLSRTPDNISNGAKYALSAYRIAATAGIDTEDGWLTNQMYAFGTYRDFIRLGAKNLMPEQEYKKALQDFPPEDMVRFTIPIDCAGAKSDFFVYVWQWSRNYPQTDPQIAWLKQARGCDVSQEVTESFRRVYAISVKEGVNFPNLAKYAYSDEAPPASTVNQAGSSTATTAPNAAASEQILRGIQEAEARRTAAERERHEETLRANKAAARQQCEAERTICSTQCAQLRGSRESDPWYSISPRAKCQLSCALIKCE